MKIIAFPNFARYESAFALLTDETPTNEVKYITIDEERLIREKHTYGFPLMAMDYCLNYFKIKDLTEIDLLVTDYARRPSMYNDGPGYRKLEHDYLKSIIDVPKDRTVIVNHHLAHAAGVYYPSKFKECAILIVDGMGSDLETQSIYYAKDDKIDLLDKGYLWGPGALYSEITGKIIGFKGLNGVDLSGKTMGLAPLGRNAQTKITDIRSKYSGMHTDYSHFISRFPKPIIKQNLKVCKNKQDVTNKYFSRIAYEVQLETEKALLHFANHAYKLTNCKNLCISGGVGLNSVANGRIKKETPFENVYITPCCSDTGISLALALYGYYQHTKPNKPKNFFMPHAYTGISYSTSSIKKMLDRFNIKYEKKDIEKVAIELTNQKIIGLFTGGSEIGPRALGHRSIVVDPRKKEMKDILNKRVKHREAFRPFAPVILEECVNEYFPITHKTQFMVEVFSIHEKMRSKIPATVHVDGTGRLQTVSKDESVEFYDLIKAFYKLTGVPVILNTSFNDQEPIVETPRDALITFLSTEMDILVLEDYIIYKNTMHKKNIKLIIETLTQERKNEIEKGITKAKTKYFNNYSEEGCTKFIKEEELIAEWHLKFCAKKKVEDFIEEQKSKKDKIVIYGTNKHTRVLYERLFDFPTLNVVGFINFPTHEHEQVEFEKYSRVDEKILLSGDYDKVFISSHEYYYSIISKLDILKIPLEKRVMIYDNANDSLIRHLDYLPIYNPLA